MIRATVPLGLLFALCLSRESAAQTAPRGLSLHHDEKTSPASAPLTRFGTLGEPLAYMDWLCIRVAGDLGATLSVRLADLDVTNERGERLGNFVSKSGTSHELRAFHVRATPESPEVFRYCTPVRPREDSEASVRFVADDAHTKRLEKVVLGIRGERNGCEDANGQSAACGELLPTRATFTYGASATAFSSISMAYARAADLSGPAIGTQARALLQMPLLVVSAGSTRHFALELDAGVSIPLVLAATDARPGFGLGAFWSQCLVARFAVVPRACIGVSLDAMVDARVVGSRIEDPAPRAVGSWFVSLGFGAR